MQTVYSIDPLERISFYPIQDEKNIVFLRDNIHPATFGPSQTPVSGWQADEVMLRTDLTKEEIEADFDNIWVKAEVASQPLEKRVEYLEELLSSTLDVLLEGE